MSEHRDTLTIICPHCGYKKDPAECGMGDGDEEDIDCGRCGKSFRVYCTVLRTFTTEGTRP